MTVRAFMLDLNTITDAIVDVSRDAFGDDLVGVYLHGSAAMGCWNPSKSDVDVIVVVDDAPNKDAKLRFLDCIVDINSRATKKGVEISVVRRGVCKNFVYPTPYELHFSPTHLVLYNADKDEYLRRLCGVDRDLAAHFTVINKYGVALCGAPVSDVFGEVDAEYYFDSIAADVECARDDIKRDPLYVTLNLCRVLAYARDGLILSKKDGGKWGLEHLPKRFRPLISSAVRCYIGDDESEYTSAASDFADYALGEIESALRARHIYKT